MPALPDAEGEYEMTDVVVIGAGPAGLIAALCAANLGARVALVARTEFGGMMANDGPVPVRTLSQGARLIREARELGRFGVAVSESVLDYRRLLARVREVVDDVRSHVAVRERIDALGVTIHERAGTARFADPHTIVTESGLRLEAGAPLASEINGQYRSTGARMPVLSGQCCRSRSATFDRRIAAADHSRETGSIATACLARSSSPLSPTTQSHATGGPPVAAR
jgi:hypothetical protein